MASAFASTPPAPPQAGVSETLARERAEAISALAYQISFAIPQSRSEPVRGSETVRFMLGGPRRIVLDFDQPRERILSVHAGDKPVEPALVNGHLIVPASATRAGQNTIAIEFLAGEDSLNRNADFLYTLFVPARAHLAFPCFDQPDLKARYALTLEVPPDWQAVANGAELDRTAAPGAGARVRFAETEPLPTYLFAFAAGRFSVETAQRNGRTFHMFHRETDAEKVARNRDDIFDLHARALAWLEDYTGIPYPWGKFDFVLIPSFQFGGMEHAGAILYNSSSLLLEESATQNQRLARASVISHETAHMWFGDFVTMRWFNDVWMKEVMANFLAAKIVNPSFPGLNHDLRFLLAHYPSAYAIDRTAGANPIRQRLENLSQAGTLYGNIIYDKAPIVMRQLELLVGEQNFRLGLRDYLNQYAFGNATWLDLVRILGRHTTANVAEWSRVWVEQRGRPAFDTELRLGADGRIARLALRQSDGWGRNLIWPQRLRVVLGYANREESLPVLVEGAVTDVAAARGRNRPLYVLPNGDGLGYGRLLLDPETLRYLLSHIEDIQDELTRGSAWVDLWDNLLEARIAPSDFINLAVRALPRESNEQNTQLVLGYLTRAFWLFLPQSERLARAPGIEELLRQGISRAPTASEKSAWFSAFRDVALTPDGIAWLERLWRREEKIEGLPFAETDEIPMAFELAVREAPGWQRIMEEQRDRTQDPDRKARFEFVMPALSADPAARERAFERFLRVDNRRREPWVIESLGYLHHPLREPEATRTLRATLDLLPEIQRTGDIFFPQRWVDAALRGHRSPEAAAIVRDFLARRPDLPERLRWTVLSAADELFRAAK